MKQKFSQMKLMSVVNVIECHLISLPQVVYLEIVFGSAILQLYLALGSCLHNGRNLIREVLGCFDCCVCAVCDREKAKDKLIKQIHTC